MLIWAAIVVWGILAGALASFAVHWINKREQARRLKAYHDILHEKGVEPKPNETLKQTLLRARRAETGAPSMRPAPSFARSILQRPKSRPSWASDPSALDTSHVSGHTPGSDQPLVRPRGGLIMPTPPHVRAHRKA